MLTGNGVMHDGETIHEDYGYRPDRVKVCEPSVYTYAVRLIY